MFWGGGILNKTEYQEQLENESVELAIYLNEEKVTNIPSKEGSVLDIEKSSCTNNATITWDYETWSPVIKNVSSYPTKCTLYFRDETFSDILIRCSEKDIASNCLIENGAKNTIELAFDETADNNLRYIGANPNNYVSFNNELWRIIGSMNNIDDGTGKKETRLKIIRDESIGNYSWDNKGESGENDWSTSTLQEVLNSGAYWNRTSGECPYGGNNATTLCDFSSNGLTSDAKEMIGNSLWNLGGSNTWMNVTTNMFYEKERGAEVYNGNALKWIGEVGLMFPSDYGYATSGGNTTSRDVCLAKPLYLWDNNDLSDCKNNNWIYENTSPQWTITQHYNSIKNMFVISFSGRSDYPTVINKYIVKPSLYLKSNIKIIEGKGSQNNPYILSL